MTATNKFAQLRRIDAKMDELSVARERILGNVERWEGETGLEAWRRLERYRLYQGRREARFLLTGERGKKASAQSPAADTLLVRTFNLLAGLRNSAMRLDDMAGILGYSTRQIIRTINVLERYKLVSRVKEPGKPTSYAITWPETVPYLEALEFAVAMRFERLQRLRDSLEYFVPDEAGVAA